MTIRAVILGLLCGAAIAWVCYFNDFVMQQTFLIGNYMPISVYGGLLLFLLLVNPLLLRVSRGLVLSGSAARRSAQIGVFCGVALCATLWATGWGMRWLYLARHALPAVAYGSLLVAVLLTDPLFLALPKRLAPTGRAVGRAALLGAGIGGVLVFCCWQWTDLKLSSPNSELLALVGGGGLVLLILAANPLALCVSKPVALSGRELATAVAITLAACYVPGRGLMHYFSTLLMLPHHYARTIPGWKEERVVDLVPKPMLAGVRPAYRSEDVLRPRELCAKLVADAASAKPSTGRQLWDLLPADSRAAAEAFLKAGGGDSSPPGALVDGLNQAIRKHCLYVDASEFQKLALPKEASDLVKRGWDALSAEDAQTLNRHLLDSAFPKELRSLGASEDRALNGFVQGLGVGSQHIEWDEIPWYAWTRTMGFWLPLLIAFSLAMIGIALVVHRQWSAHEQLPYPIVTFASALLPAEGETQGGIFRSRLFWIGVLPVLLIHMNNYGYEWWPRYLIQVPRTFDFRSLTPLIPSIQRFGDWALMNPTFYFTAIGFAYFLATDVSLSLGIAPYLYAVVVGTLMGYGVSVAGGGFIALNIQTFLFGGAYFGMFLVLLYTGRHYYVNVLREALFPGGDAGDTDRVEPLAAWGARVFLVGALLFALQLILVGLSWYLALLYTAGAVVIYVVISRVVAETGVFFIHAYHFPCVLMWGFFGAKVLGPQAMLIMFLVTSLLLIDPREAVMPFMVQGFKLAEKHKVKLGRTAWFAALALVISFAIAVPVTLYWQYDRGASTVSDYWCRYVPQMSFDAAVRAQQTLRAQGNLELAGLHSGADWFRNLSPNWNCVKAFGLSLALVLGFSVGRMRFSRWPIHPILFLVLGTYQSRTLGASFLLGWLIKVAVTKYGGASAYQKLKPLMIGIIAGDMLGGLLPMIIGAIYWHFTGEPPKRFMVLTY